VLAEKDFERPWPVEEFVPNAFLFDLGA